MNVLNLLAAGSHGGIESLCNNIDKNSRINNYWVFMFYGGKIAEEMKQRNPENVFILGYPKRQCRKYIETINDICVKLKIDIVTLHHGGTYCNLIYTKLKKKNPNIKFVKYLHSCYEDKYNLEGKFIKDKVILYYINKMLQISDSIISVSNAVKKSYEEKFNIKSKNKVVIYNGIADEFFNKELKDRKPFDGRTVKIIYVGRLVKEKGIDILIDAVSQLIQEGYDISFTIVGDGTERKTLESKVLQENLQNNIKFVGSQTNVIDWLDNADIFVYPSICEEAFGISVVEAMARGCIPIVSNKGGLPEVVGNNEKYLFNSEKELNLKIKNMIKENEIDNARTIELAKKFSIKIAIENLKKVYDNLIGERNL